MPNGLTMKPDAIDGLRVDPVGSAKSAHRLRLQVGHFSFQARDLGIVGRETQQLGAQTGWIGSAGMRTGNHALLAIGL